MSIKMMSLLWDIALEQSERTVLQAMADHADHEGRNIFPSVGLIAWKTDLSERQVQRVIKKMLAKGYLRKQGMTAKGTNVYCMDLSGATKKPPYRRGVKMSPHTGDKMSGEGDNLSWGGDTAMSPEPSINPSKNKYNFAANGYANAAPPANNAIADVFDPSSSSNLPDSATQPKTKSSKKALKEGGKGDTSPLDLSIVPAISVSITPTNVKCVVDKNDVRHYIVGDASKSICGRTAFVEKECYGGAYEKQCEKCATTHALASICYQEVSVALNQNISVLNRVLKDLRPTLEQLRCFYARWKAEDFRGKKGARPSPSMVKSEWANYSTPFLVQTEGDSLALTTPEPQPDPQCPFCAGSGYSSVYVNTRTNTIVTHDEYVRNFSNIDYQRTSERCACVK